MMNSDSSIRRREQPSEKPCFGWKWLGLCTTVFHSQWLGPPPEECDLSSKVEAGLKESAPEADGTTTVLATGQRVLSWRRAEWHISKSATVLPVCHMSPLIHTHLGSPYPEFPCPCLCEGTLRRMILMWIKYDPFHSGDFQVFPEMESFGRSSCFTQNIHSCPLPWAF